MATPLYGTENFSTTLNVGGGINDSQTTGIVLTSVSGLNTNGGVLGLTWASTIDSSTYEEIIYTGISGNELTGVTRGSAGTSAKAHNNGATVVAVVSSLHNNRIADKLRSVDAVLAQDTSANEIIKTSFVASAVNEVTITNAATGNPPKVEATGGDTNIDLRLIPKGSGALSVPSGTYEANVTDDDDIPNKKYVDDLAGTGSWTAAGETWTYASADDPTFTFTIAGVDKTTKYYPGMKVKLTQTTDKFFIITKVAFSTDTTVTIYGGTDYDLANAAITSPTYSTAATPPAFPKQKSKWTVEVTDTTQRTQAGPSASTWYNINAAEKIDIPIGAWDVDYEVCAAVDNASATQVDVYVTLSTANNSESDKKFTSLMQISGASGNMNNVTTTKRGREIALTSKATYYLNSKTDNAGIDNLNHRNDLATLVIRAVSQYI